MAEKGFEKALAETTQGTLIQVQVVPRSKNFAVIGFEEWSQALKVRLKAKPEKGKANQELVENLQKTFNARVEIIAGKKGSKKRLLVHAKKNRVAKALGNYFGQRP